MLLNLRKLVKNYNRTDFSGFYIISTPLGLVTSHYCLLQGHSSGEVLMKIEI